MGILSVLNGSRIGECSMGRHWRLVMRRNHSYAPSHCRGLHHWLYHMDGVGVSQVVVRAGCVIGRSGHNRPVRSSCAGQVVMCQWGGS